MIGAVIFVIFFLLFLVVTIGMPTLPIGDMIQQQILKIPKVDYPVLGIPGWILINAILNGVIYGFIIWLIFSLVNMATKRKQKVYRCKLCNMTFATKEALETHAKTHEKTQSSSQKPEEPPKKKS